LVSNSGVQHKLTLMRQKDASTNSFRRLLDELSTLMAYEVTRDMPLQDVEIETPLETMTGQMIDGKKLVLVSILRAGDGFLDGMLRVVPGARVGHIGLYRDPATRVRHQNADFAFLAKPLPCESTIYAHSCRNSVVATV
jgi:uracil phosphoribosyltransferase